MPNQCPKVTSYTDYRQFLRDVIRYRKSRRLSATNRWFSDQLGIGSSSWLTSLLQGKIGLSLPTAQKLATTLELDEFETRYFTGLVTFTQASTIEQRNDSYLAMTRELTRQRPYAVGQVSKHQYEFYSKWYYSAVRSLIGMHRLGDDYDRIASMTDPAIRPAQAKKAVKLLLKLGFIRKAADGTYELTGSAISTGPDIQSLAIANFQREMMKLAAQSLERHPRHLRDMSTMTVGISAGSLGKVRAAIEECRRKIEEIANDDEHAHMVFQVNVQAFPLSAVGDESRTEETHDRQ